MNNKPDVKQETQDRVEQSIADLAYSPNIVARGLVLKRSKVLGFIVPDILNPSFPELARGVVARASNYGYSVMFFDTNHDNKVEKEAIRLLQSKQVDGIILSFDDANKDELEKLKLENFPVVQIYRKSSKSAIATIAIDNLQSGYTATKYLIDSGHRRIGHISTGNNSQSGHERLDGYKQALKEAGISYRETWVQMGNNSAESGRECMENLLKADAGITAVFASHDIMAAGAYDAIYDAGLSVPDDISIVGHDNNQISRLIRPKLTTMDTHKDRLGQSGVDLLMEEIGKLLPSDTERLFPTELIRRESVRVAGE